MSVHRLANATGQMVRAECSLGTFTGTTAGVARGYVQANLVIVPECDAADFQKFCAANPKPCPLLEVLKPGETDARRLAPGSDLRVDLPRYRVLEQGKCVATPIDLHEQWRDDLVSFLIGCSFTFETALLEAGIPVRHIELGCNVPMFRTDRPCVSAGRFESNLVVSMRPMTKAQATVAEKITGAFSAIHGAPIHVGDARELGIHSLENPDFGDAVPVAVGEVPVFWACGVTPMLAIERAGLEFAIVHEPGHMFVTDLRDEELRDAPS